MSEPRRRGASGPDEGGGGPTGWFHDGEEPTVTDWGDPTRVSATGGTASAASGDQAGDGPRRGAKLADPWRSTVLDRLRKPVSERFRLRRSTALLCGVLIALAVLYAFVEVPTTATTPASLKGTGLGICPSGVGICAAPSAPTTTKVTKTKPKPAPTTSTTAPPSTTSTVPTTPTTSTPDTTTHTRSTSPATGQATTTTTTGGTRSGSTTTTTTPSGGSTTSTTSQNPGARSPSSVSP